MARPMPGTRPLADEPDSARELQVRADLIGTIYRHIPRSSLGVLAGALTVAWGMWGQIDHTAILAWLGTICIIMAWRLVLYQVFPGTKSINDRVGFWEWNWALSTAVHGSVWGSTAFLMYVPDSPEYQALLLIALFAISTAAVPLVARYRPSLYAFVLTVLLPIMLRLALEGGAMGIALVMISALVMYGIFIFGTELNQTITESVRRRYENIDLIDQLTAQTARAETARLEADQANRMKTRFLAAASHDLRQPMHALGLFSDSLRRRIQAPEERMLAERICQSAETIEQTFDALLDISRLDAGVVQPRDEAVPLQALMERVYRDCAPEAQAKGIALRMRATPLGVRSDTLLVERILRNLVTNAIRYTHRGGVLMACRAQGHRVSIEVWDTGIGIPCDKQNRIFEEFYQAAERDRREGLGLGLAIVQRLTRLLHAELNLHSVEGRGSVFKFMLPRCIPSSSEAGPSETKAESANSAVVDAVVLVIDDDPNVLDAMSESLRSWGLRAVAARSLQTALERLPECGRYPDAIVSDFRLGEHQNGIDAVARIRHELGMAIPAMIVTGDTAPRSLRLIQASGLRCLPKPVTPERLLQELTAMLAGASPPLAVDEPMPQ
jgi:signal transduction histidine kinase/CheY-like chemotaxis protein